MSIYVDILREHAANGWPALDDAADELDSCEKAYGLLYDEASKLKAELAKKDAEIAELKKHRCCVTLTGQQLKEALELVAPDGDEYQLKTEATICDLEGHSGPGVYVHITEYPEEGAMALFDVAAE